MEYSNFNSIKTNCDTLDSKDEKLSFMYTQLQEWELRKPASGNKNNLGYENVYDRTIRLLKVEIEKLKTLSKSNPEPVNHITMNKFNVIISKATNERDILAYLNREMKIAESNEFYEPYDFINDLLLTLSNLEQTENYSFERELNQLKDKMSKNVITYHINHDYYTFCIDRNENRSFDDYVKEQYPIRESQLQTEIQRLTDKHDKIINQYESVKIAIKEITTLFDPEPDQLPKQFTKTLTTEQQNYLYRKLTEKGLFLPIDTNPESFNFVFGGNVKPYKFEPLQWQQNKQLLRELLEPLRHPDIEIKADFERDVSDYFIDTKYKVIVLPKNKVVESILHNTILSIINKLGSPDKVLATL